MAGTVLIFDPEEPFDIPEIGDRQRGDCVFIARVIAHPVSISFGLSKPRRDIMPEE